MKQLKTPLLILCCALYSPASVFASDCGALPSLEINGHALHASQMPTNYTVIDSDYGMHLNIYPFFYHPLPLPHVGVLTAIRNNVVESVDYDPIGEPREVEGITFIVRNDETDCETHSYEMTYTSLVEAQETWEISSSFSSESALEESIKFGIEFSSTSVEYGLSSSQRYTTTSGTSFSASAQIGTGFSVSGGDRDIAPCHERWIVAKSTIQDYSTTIVSYRNVYDLNGYFDTSMNGTWDTRGNISISCSPTGHTGHISRGSASAFGGTVIASFQGPFPIPDADCPCPCINEGARAGEGCDGGGGDMDDDGIPDEDDSDMDGDGLGNDHDNDVDGDGIPNDEDPDDDNDGVPDDQDDNPRGPDEDDDIDGDGIPNGEDDDIDGDGIPNDEDDDMDGDGVPNDEDLDDDADGITDIQEAIDAIRRFLNWVMDFIRRLV